MPLASLCLLTTQRMSTPPSACGGPYSPDDITNRTLPSLTYSDWRLASTLRQGHLRGQKN
jgi:hypothetical protein